MTGCAHQTIAERAGVLEDYLLTSASVGGQQSSAPGSAQPAPGATGTSGTQASGNIQSTYKIEGIADERLKALVGKRVEVTGRVDADDQREATRAEGNDWCPDATNHHALGGRRCPGIRGHLDP